MPTNASTGARSVADLIFSGFNSRIAALDRSTGELVWRWKSPRGGGYVSLLLDGEQVIASVNGYTYCLDARTGAQLWANPLKGFGLGVASMASVRGGSMGASLLAQTAASRSASAAGGTSAST